MLYLKISLFTKVFVKFSVLILGWMIDQKRIDRSLYVWSQQICDRPKKQACFGKITPQKSLIIKSYCLYNLTWEEPLFTVVIQVALTWMS